MGPVNTIMHVIGIINSWGDDVGRIRIWSQWDLGHAPNPWARVQGPMGAAQRHVGDMQWLNDTLRLKDHNGDIWQPNFEYGTGLMRHMLEEARIQHLWTIAAQHRHGAGMEN
eukprot:4625411-Karenia_brevis.AAC.1